MKKVTEQEFIDFLIKFEGKYYSKEEEIYNNIKITTFSCASFSYTQENTYYTYHTYEILGKIVETTTEVPILGFLLNKIKKIKNYEYYINEKVPYTFEEQEKILTKKGYKRSKCT